MNASSDTPGPDVRTDLVDVYLFRRPAGGPTPLIELLQLRRAREPLAGHWMPVMGHAERGEPATDTARREAHEETGLDIDDETLGFWCLEQVNPYYLPELDAVFMTPRFVAEVRPGWEPVLNEEHSGVRWLRCSVAPIEEERRGLLARWLWPGQREAVGELLEHLAPPGGTATGRAMAITRR